MIHLPKLSAVFANGLKIVILAIFLIISVYPFVWIIFSSFKTNLQITDTPAALPSTFKFTGYRLAIKLSPLTRYYSNSIIVAASTMVAATFITTMSGYALARFRFKLRNAVVIMISAALLVPVFSLMYPIYVLFRNLGLIDTKLGLVIFYAAVGLPVRLYILRSYFLSLPRDLEESAYLDGAGIFRTFIQIMVPLAKPGIATVATLTFISTWNEFFFALLLTSSDRARTLPVSLNYFLQAFFVNYTAMFAAMVMITLPTIVVFFLLQDQVVGSLAKGAIKG